MKQQVHPVYPDLSEMRDHLRDLIGHQFWADAELWQAFLSSPDPENAGIRRRWYHVHVMERAFLEIASGVG